MSAEKPKRPWVVDPKMENITMMNMISPEGSSQKANKAIKANKIWAAQGKPVLNWGAKKEDGK